MKMINLNYRYKAIVIGGSAGSFKVVGEILQNIPKNLNIPIILCLHRLKNVRSGFVEALNIKSVREVIEPLDKDFIRMKKVYLAPSNYHLSVELGNTFALSTDDAENNSRPSIDITFRTAAYAYRNQLIGILLSGANKDGAKGMRCIQDKGGLTIVQAPEECLIDTMPKEAMKITKPDYIYRTDQIIDFIKQLEYTFS